MAFIVEWRNSATYILDALEAANKRIAEYRIALADAIARPMGVAPHTADGLVTEEEMAAAEKRRPKGSTRA